MLIWKWPVGQFRSVELDFNMATTWDGERRCKTFEYNNILRKKNQRFQLK